MNRWTQIRGNPHGEGGGAAGSKRIKLDQTPKKIRLDPTKSKQKISELFPAKTRDGMKQADGLR
jgi:hypothetical protein